MKKVVTAVFDIGKTNKKFFLFDNDYKEVYREYTRFAEIKDEDGYPTENLPALQTWLKDVFHNILEAKEYKIKAINFSTYGASLVHLDADGNVLTPLYNYTKPMDEACITSFYEKYGPELQFTQETGSSNSGMLNSGMQLYWLKYYKPEVFKKIKYSLHFPQYLSYIFTGIPLSEYTSIGCHTALWNYSEKDYHQWVYKENLHKILPPIVSTETSINMNYNGKRIKIGVGIHDSSSALLPYVRSINKPFILVSTGTWSITLNPFFDGILSEKDIQSGCINYMRINGKAVKSSRIFLGHIYRHNVQKLARYYRVYEDYHKSVMFDYEMFSDIDENFQPFFNLESPEALKEEHVDFSQLPYNCFEEAYHHLMLEIVQLQLKSIKTAKGKSKIKKLYVDGGFSANNVYINLLSHYLRHMKLRTTTSSLGSALGAAIAISDAKLNSKFLKHNYALQKHTPFIVS